MKQKRITAANARRVSMASGLTFVEILGVITIMTLMAVLMWGGFASYANRQTFRTTVTDVKSGIVDVRQKTLASENDMVYGFYASSTAVVFFQGATYTEGDSDNVTINLPTDITATPLFTGGVQDIVFTRLTGVASATGTLTFFSTKADQYATITVNATGLIE